MQLTIRPAGPTDLALLAEMNRHLIEDEGSTNPMTLEQLYERMRGWLAGEYAIEILLYEAEPAGYAVYRLEHDRCSAGQPMVYLRQFYIERDLRGRGLGSAAFKRLCRDRFPAGARIVLDVLFSNPSGIRFWSRLGFQPYSMQVQSWNRDSGAA